MAGSIEEANKANSALAPLFPLMLLLMLAVIIIQVRSFSAMWMVMLTGPLGLIGAVPALLIFHQPFGFNRSEEHTSELQSHHDLVCRLLLEKKKKNKKQNIIEYKINNL